MVPRDIVHSVSVLVPEMGPEYVLPTCWMHRIRPDPSLPGNATPFKLLFNREPRTPLDTIARNVDGVEFRGGFDGYVADKYQSFIEVQE